ncbi:unnamed protein product [Acanthoscelides obtectus]|uniref:Uncharacterized protein n=1 Tax=Acanthoscelides obtectus TaxID=200917 RepID=A0A9P0LYJ1_ACAOB|nr:unnamed protein product [Acanthoscelides obtectus]CAK1680529.1 hypothetical protein AOBTE_LOCUS32730 [Acanthoscelides obtectus]
MTAWYIKRILSNKQSQFMFSLLVQRLHSTVHKKKKMIIIDVQGFTCGSNFICKEIAIINTATGYWQQKLVNLPVEFTMLNKSTQSQINWTVDNLHGIPWDLSLSEESCLDYKQLASFIKEHVQGQPIFEKRNSGWKDSSLIPSPIYMK